MARRMPVNRDKQEALEERRNRKKTQPQADHEKTTDEGVIDTHGESSLEGHAALLAGARSDRQRANLVIQLQQSHGNAYVQRLLSSKVVQAKLTVNPPDDQYEKEADKVADKVMQVQTPDVQRQEMPEEEEAIQAKVSDIQRGARPVMVAEELEEEEEEMEAEAAMGPAGPAPAPAAPPAPAAAPAGPAAAPAGPAAAPAGPAAAPAGPAAAPAPGPAGIPAPPGAHGGGYEEAMGFAMEPYEAEEEEEAEELARKPSNDIQRQIEEEEEPLQTKASDINLQAEPEEEEEEAVQAKESEQSALEVGGNLEQRIETARGGGQPLQESTRNSLEPQLGHDFNNVRVHNDTEADNLSRQLGADAFTTGRDVFFKEGTYDPDSERGQGLIAHELTHVVQQSAAPDIQRKTVTENKAENAELGGGKGIDKARLSALKAVFEAAVVGQLRDGYKALSGEKPDAKQAYTSVRAAYDVVKSLVPSYKGVEPIFSRLVALANVILTIGDTLEPHIGITRPLSEISENLNPDGAVMGGYMEFIKSQL